MVLQGLVDHCGWCTSIIVGWIGKVHGARIFRNSGLFSAMINGSFVPRTTTDIDCVAISPVILRDANYLLLPWLMMPFISHLDRRKDLFSYTLSSFRMTVECAFKR